MSGECWKSQSAARSGAGPAPIHLCRTVHGPPDIRPYVMPRSRAGAVTGSYAKAIVLLACAGPCFILVFFRALPLLEV